MPFEIVRNDITNMQVDAIVNTANPRPVIGSGTDAAVHAKAGPMLLHARRLHGVLKTGEVFMTPGFRLPAKHVIHTVGPVWQGGGCAEAEQLRQCYENALALARRRRLRSIAFPLISTGNYGFPKELSLRIAVEAIRKFLDANEMQVFLVVFSKESYGLSEALTEHVRSYIDEAYVQQKQKLEYGFSVSRDFDYVRRQLEERPEPGDTARLWEICPPAEYPRAGEEIEYGASAPEAFPKPCAPMEDPRPWMEIEDENVYASGPDEEFLLPLSSEDAAPAPSKKVDAFPEMPSPREKKKQKPVFDPKELNQMVRQVDAGFSETLLKLIDETGEKDSDIYKRANIDRKLFSKIRNNPQYKPSKSTALAFAIALELDLEQTRDFIGRAGYALSRSSTFDIIVEYYITHGRYDIYEINMVLFEFDQNLLGAYSGVL